ARQLHTGLAPGEIDHTHVAPEHAAAQTGAEGLGAGLLRRKALGIGRSTLCPLVGFLALNRGEYSAEEAFAETLNASVDAAYVNQIGTQPDDHLAAKRCRPRASSISARMRRMEFSRHMTIASTHKTRPKF